MCLHTLAARSLIPGHPSRAALPVRLFSALSRCCPHHTPSRSGRVEVVGAWARLHLFPRLCSSSQACLGTPSHLSCPLWDRPHRECPLSAQVTLQVSPEQPKASDRSFAQMLSLWERTVSSQTQCGGPTGPADPHPADRAHMPSGWLTCDYTLCPQTSAYGTTLLAPKG